MSAFDPVATLAAANPVPKEHVATLVDGAQLLEILHDVRARASRAPTSRRARRLPSRRVQLITAAVVAAVTGAAFASGLLGRASHAPTHVVAARSISTRRPAHPRPTSGPSTNVRSLLAFTRDVHAVRTTDLPPGVTELMNLAQNRFGESVTNIQEPIAGTASIYLVTFGSNELCTYLAIHGAVGGCRATLHQADGSLDVSFSVVDRKLFVSGVAANDVRSIIVTIASTSMTPGTTAPVQAEIADNVFVTPKLPFNGMGTGPITITATHADGSTSSATRPGIPGCPVCGRAHVTSHP